MATRKKPEIKSLYYITHVENLRSILRNGIFSHRQIEEKGIEYKRIYDGEIVAHRGSKNTPSGRSLWTYANTYFQPRNPMLYRVIHEKGCKEIVVIALRPSILSVPDSYITDGNAANTPTQFFQVDQGLKVISQNWTTIQNEWWNSQDGSKRRIMAEFLVPDAIPAEDIHTIYVANHEAAERARGIVGSAKPVIPEPNMFFLPARRHQITTSLFLAEGDMFFSNMQTLTLSVNTVGIMGKGLASRAKYQFPDVYVRYQDACRQKKLAMGKPYLYKREASYDDELMDEPNGNELPNGVKWFLLFATKTNWRFDSDFHGIEQGLKWIVDNYKIAGITSLALPALGCGLGNLDWKDVGPAICHALSKVDIQVAVYLPRESKIDKEFLTPNYLLSE